MRVPPAAKRPDGRQQFHRELIRSDTVDARPITVAVDTSFTTLDPYDAGNTLSQNVPKALYEGLFGLGRQMKVEPVLATGYEVSSDGLLYTIALRKDVKFSDGTPFTAAAVKANFVCVKNSGKHLNRCTLWKNIKAVEVKEPFLAFINELAHPSSMMMCPKLDGIT